MDPKNNNEFNALTYMNQSRNLISVIEIINNEHGKIDTVH